MDAHHKGFYQALVAHDRRFDGVFFVGVTSTGIYCRPVCTARTPKEANCRFYASPQQAEQADFRPCLRCRPELAPGNAPVDAGQRIAQLIVQRLEDGRIDSDAGLEAIAAQFELSSRQIRRIVSKELGVAPVKLLQTRRLLLAKQLLTETRLPVTRVAFASGFSSLRRFNDAFQSRYRLAPSHLRKRVADCANVAPGAQTSVLQLAYRPPYDWAGVLAFLKARELRGVEAVIGEQYVRTVRLGAHAGWIKVTQAEDQHVLLLEFAHELLPVLPALIGRLRHLFDLDARPDLIDGHLGADPHLAQLVKASPGLRVPGAFNGFELALRAIIGQQVTVRSATTVAGRVAEAFGEPAVTPFPLLTRLAPTSGRIARADVGELAQLGLVSARARSLIALAALHESGACRLDGVRTDPEDAIANLCRLPGIGPWTAHYIALRALRWPDAFPPGDIAARNSLGRASAREAERLSQAWRPWRGYALLHLWKRLSSSEHIHAQPSRSTKARSTGHTPRLGTAGQRPGRRAPRAGLRRL